MSDTWKKKVRETREEKIQQKKTQDARLNSSTKFPVKEDYYTIRYKREWDYKRWRWRWSYQNGVNGHYNKQI